MDTITMSEILRNPPPAKPFMPVDWAGLTCIWITTVVVLSRRLFDTTLGYPDADRILMDGVFIHDLLNDVPLSDIYQYTVQYFSQYPALSIGYRPPFLPLIEALFNSVFGVNMWSSRLAIQAFALMGITAWFLLVRRMFDPATAILSSLIFITLPFVAQWGLYTMAELPLVSMAMLTAYLFSRYAEKFETKFLYAAAAAFVLTVWTKQTAFYLAFWFIAYLLANGTLGRALSNRHAWIAIFGVLITLTPLAVITVWLGEQNLEQSIGPADLSVATATTQRLENLFTHLQHLYNFQLPPWTLTLSIVGLALSLVQWDKRTWYFWLLIISTYLFFSFVLYAGERYTIFWLPAFAFFAALPIHYLSGKWVRLRLPYLLVLMITVAFNTHRALTQPPSFATNYDKAAQYVVQHSRSPMVFVDAYNNGYFTYFVRQADVDRSTFVLRGDKILTSSSVNEINKLQVHASTRNDLKQIIDGFGIEYIVVEDRNYSPSSIHDELRAYLKEGPFVRELELPVESTRSALKGLKLLVYRYLDLAQRSNDEITLHLPVVGKTIKVPFPAGRHTGNSSLMSAPVIVDPK